MMGKFFQILFYITSFATESELVTYVHLVPILIVLLPIAAGQERFGTLTSSYYRGAHGIILVYDVTRRETFTSLSEVWAKEVELYSTNQECIKVLVGNKVDRDSERAVTQEEGMALAQQLKCSFLECSARTRANVHQCFKDVVLKILEVPTLLEKGSTAVKKQILQQKQVQKPPESNTCCFQ
ncbi:hypothetical protein Gotri_004718 [Gossypium trilobum]|uniref:Ras-related protein RABC2a-like n=1 Tax=Gossypium trilobum TaxID=34281 RepID=A0A7J9F5S5_9ROSI|nr:hypothetical protein [Gossypium trilobum]